MSDRLNKLLIEKLSPIKSDKPIYNFDEINWDCVLINDIGGVVFYLDNQTILIDLNQIKEMKECAESVIEALKEYNE